MTPEENEKQIKKLRKALCCLQNGGIPTLYSGDGGLAEDRVVTLNGNTLAFIENDKEFLKLNPVEETANLHSYNQTSDTKAGVFFDTEESSALSIIESVNNTNINSFVRLQSATEAIIDYSADRHTFFIEDGLLGNSFTVKSANNEWISVSTKTNDERFRLQSMSQTGDNNRVFVNGNTTDTSSTLTLTAETTGGFIQSMMELKSTLSESTVQIYGKTTINRIASPSIFAIFSVGGLSEYANNAAAILAGLIAGDFYYTNVSGDGVLKVVI